MTTPQTDLTALAKKWRDEADGVTAMGYSQQGDRMRDCANELEAALAGAQGMVVRLPDLCDSAFVCLVCWQQIDVRDVWQEPPPQNHQEPVYTHAAKDGHPVARIDRWHRAAQPPPPAVDPPALVALVREWQEADRVYNTEAVMRGGSVLTATHERFIRAKRQVLAWTPAAAAPPVAAPAVEGETQHWSVSVNRNHANLVTIESNMLAGQPEFSDEDARVIRECAAHLLAFIGPEPAVEDEMDAAKHLRDSQPRYSQYQLDEATKPLHAEIERLRQPLASGSAPAARPAVEENTSSVWREMQHPPRPDCDAEGWHLCAPAPPITA